MGIGYRIKPFIAGRYRIVGSIVQAKLTMQVKSAAFTLVAALAILPHGAVVAANAEPTEPTLSGPNQPPGAKDNFDPVYNVCRGTDRECYHAWVSDRQNKVLLYTRTAGPRHANIQPALGPGLDPPLSTTQNVAQRAIKAWLEAVGVEVHWTEDVNTLAGQLGPGSDYKAVIFLSTSRDTLWKHGTAVSTTAAVNTTTNAHLDAAKTALRQYMRAGGGFVGIHNAFGTEYNWQWYEGLLGNANYYDHGAFQDGMVKIVAAGFVHVGDQQLRLQRRVVQPGAVPDPCEVPRHCRRELAGDAQAQCTRATETSIPSPGASTTTVAVRG